MKKVKILTMDDLEKGYWDREYDEYDEYEEVYENALMTVKLIEENRRLKNENQYLQKELKEYRTYLDNQFKYSTNQVANILGSLIQSDTK